MSMSSDNKQIRVQVSALLTYLYYLDKPHSFPEPQSFWEFKESELYLWG